MFFYFNKTSAGREMDRGSEPGPQEQRAYTQHDAPFVQLGYAVGTESITAPNAGKPTERTQKLQNLQDAQQEVAT